MCVCVCACVRASVCVSVCVSVCLSACLPICLSVRLSVSALHDSQRTAQGGRRDLERLEFVQPASYPILHGARLAGMRVCVRECMWMTDM